MFTRLKSIYGKDGLARLQGARVAVAGLGGVGSYCAAALCRGGVGHLLLVDCDTIEASNINRQLFALRSSVGEKKTDVAAEVLSDINPDCDVRTRFDKITVENVDALFGEARGGIDYIVDCVDDVAAKIAMAKFATHTGVKIVSCMGTALRKDAASLQFADLFETSVCPLCRVMRHEARAADIKQLQVLYSTEKPVVSRDGKLGSTSYLPPIAGMMLAGHVIEEIEASEDDKTSGSN